MKLVYFDNAATTTIRKEVMDAMLGAMQNNYGNASSTYSIGRLSKAIIETSRKTIAKLLNVTAAEIVFTSGGTEADNFVLLSAVRDLGVKHIITSKIEHHAVLNTVKHLQFVYGITVSYVELDAFGNLDYAHLESCLKHSEKTLVSLMHINNEIGNILNITRIANLCKDYEALFHTDAVQSIGHYKLDLQNIKVDFLAASAHKFHGPKGIGFAFIRKHSGIKPILLGGEQERGLRAGTESIHNIVGLEKSMVLAYKNLDTERNYITNLKIYFKQQLKLAIPNVVFNGYSGDLQLSTYTLLNVRFPIAFDKFTMFLFQLDLKGIACSKGSACQSGSNKKSHVLTEILDEDVLKLPSIRFSFSIFNTKEEVDYTVDTLKSLMNLYCIKTS